MRLLALACLMIAGAAHAADPSPLAASETIFLDFLDASGAVGVVDSGLMTEFKGRNRESWDATLQDRHRALLDQPRRARRRKAHARRTRLRSPPCA